MSRGRIEGRCVIPDILTWSRVGIGVLFIVLAFVVRRFSFPLLVWLTCLGWLTDAMDGFLARILRGGTLSWVGERDHIVDGFFALCLLMCLLTSGSISGPFGVVFGIVGFFSLLLRSRVLNMTFITGVYLALILLAFHRSVALGCLMIGFALVVLALEWNRFKHLVRLYLRGAQALVHRREDETA